MMRLLSPPFLQLLERAEAEARTQGHVRRLLSEVEELVIQAQGEIQSQEAATQAASAALSSAGGAADTLQAALAALLSRMEGLRLDAQKSAGALQATSEHEEPGAVDSAALEGSDGSRHPAEIAAGIEVELRSYLKEWAAAEGQVMQPFIGTQASVP
jgi:hypothetical protein